MPRSVYKVENVFFALVFVIEPARLQFYGDAPFFLDFHIVEKLLGHISLADRPRFFHKTIGKSAFAVIDVRYYGKVAYV